MRGWGQQTPCRDGVRSSWAQTPGKSCGLVCPQSSKMSSETVVALKKVMLTEVWAIAKAKTTRWPPILMAPQMRTPALHNQCGRSFWEVPTARCALPQSFTSSSSYKGVSNKKHPSNTKGSINQKFPITPRPPRTRENKSFEFCYALGKGTANRVCARSFEWVCMCHTRRYW